LRLWLFWLLLALAFLALGVGLYPRRSDGTDPTTGDVVKETTLGLWFSPVYRSVRREKVGPQRFGFSEEVTFQLLSWSGLLTVLGVVCATGAWRRLRRSSGHPAPAGGTE
jgi:hypothetical protein